MLLGLPLQVFSRIRKRVSGAESGKGQKGLPQMPCESGSRFPGRAGGRLRGIARPV